MRFISDANINPLYEAAIETTEEAVLNAIFFSRGINGRDSHSSPPVPVETVREILSRGVLAPR